MGVVGLGRVGLETFEGRLGSGPRNRLEVDLGGDRLEFIHTSLLIKELVFREENI